MGDQRARLRLECLEPRIVPAANIWTGGGGDSDWFNSKNWTAGVPQYYDAVEIPTGTVVLASFQEGAYVSSVTVNGGNLFIEGTLNADFFSQTSGTTTIESGGNLWTYGVTQDGGSLIVQGYLDASSFSQNTGSTSIASSGNLWAGEFSQSGGTITISGGTITSYHVGLYGGVLSGYGTLNTSIEGTGQVLNDGGELSVSGSLFIAGSYTQTAAGTLTFSSIGSTASRTAPLEVSDPAMLDGTLNVNISASAAGTYLLMSYPVSSGTFSTVNVTLPSGFVFSGLNYGDTELTISVAEAPPTPADTIPITDTFVITVLLNDSATSTTAPTSTSAASNEATAEFMVGDIQSGNIVAAPAVITSGGGGTTQAITNDPEAPGAALHGYEYFEVDTVLAADVDWVLKVQMGSFGTAKEDEVLSGALIAEALLTGTTPRTDLMPQGSQVAAVATLVVSTDVNRPTTVLAAPTDDIDLDTLLITPMQGYVPTTDPAAPADTTSQEPAPTTLPGEERQTFLAWWSLAALLGTASGAFHLAFSDSSRQRRLVERN